MTLAITELERQEHRIVAAMRCVDATTRVSVDVPLQVDVANARIQRNRSGLYVIVAADALANFADSFDAQPATPLGSVTLTATIRDISGRYLPRVAALVPAAHDPIALECSARLLAVQTHRDRNAPGQCRAARRQLVRAARQRQCCDGW